MSGPPDFYLKQARKHKENKNYALALSSLTKLKERFFYGKWSPEALLLKADIYFQQAKYSSAIRHYKSYFRAYPLLKRDYALYQIGMSYKNQLPRRSVHDLKFAEPAIQAFDKLLRLKPSSAYKEKAFEAKKQIEGQLAEKDLRAILFYKKLAWDGPGLSRLKRFIKKYPESPLMPKALLAGLRMAERSKADPKNFKQALRDRYPDSPEFEKSKKRESFFSNWRAWLL